ncbi:hypothetical protein NM208_g14822 [Fusarium decemcellulare]|uniref:Uncharacterized protein n=1 Tax=Fusarium decemcellulare TaxID=57161 RepID=A0ACC1RHD0_9HYPO|nr:hypothetical protein NM208_g14822 [Fusarium decemcellulare]
MPSLVVSLCLLLLCSLAPARARSLRQLQHPLLGGPPQEPFQHCGSFPLQWSNRRRLAQAQAQAKYAPMCDVEIHAAPGLENKSAVQRVCSDAVPGACAIVLTDFFTDLSSISRVCRGARAPSLLSRQQPGHVTMISIMTSIASSAVQPLVAAAPADEPLEGLRKQATVNDRRTLFSLGAQQSKSGTPDVAVSCFRLTTSQLLLLGTANLAHKFKAKEQIVSQSSQHAQRSPCDTLLARKKAIPSLAYTRLFDVRRLNQSSQSNRPQDVEMVVSNPYTIVSTSADEYITA